MSSTATSTSSASTSSQTDTSNMNTGDSLGAATYYGAIALTIIAIFAFVIISRIFYTRRSRKLHAQERLELRRRGEAEGLPTYRETTAPQTLNYLTSRPGFLRPPGNSPGYNVSYDMPQPPSSAYFSNQGSGQLPAYTGAAPPKYEDGGSVTRQPSTEEGQHEPGELNLNEDVAHAENTITTGSRPVADEEAAIEGAGRA
ncbi:hypothetical protein T439DRAFT_330031 [Meredithblackwellia eburnea MCA 4105]